jgi:hypothetical protein
MDIEIEHRIYVAAPERTIEHIRIGAGPTPKQVCTGAAA